MIHNKDRLVDKNKNSFIITHNLKGKAIRDWVNQYKSNEALRTRNRKDSVRLTHEILSWHKEDSGQLTLAKIENMTREYLRERNPRGMYLAVPHFDKQHYHVHICASGVEYKTGKSMRLTKMELQTLKKEIENYQRTKYPELTRSITKPKSKGLLTDEKEYQFKLRTGRQSNREHVAELIKNCLTTSSSKHSFLTMLEKKGLQTYKRNEKINGVIFNANKYRFSRLGFTHEQFERLETFSRREKDIDVLREGRSQRQINRMPER